MLVCRKPRAVFDQRYVVKTVYEVAQLRVEPMLHQPRTKVGRQTATALPSCYPPSLCLQGQFGLQIFYGGNVEIEVFAKTDEMKKRWMDAIKQAKYIQPFSLFLSSIFWHSFTHREVIAPQNSNRGEVHTSTVIEPWAHVVSLAWPSSSGRAKACRALPLTVGQWLCGQHIVTERERIVITSISLHFREPQF